MRYQMTLCVVISNIPINVFVFLIVIVLMSEYDHARNSILGKDASKSCEIFVFLISKSVLQLFNQTFSEAVVQKCCLLKSCSEKFRKICKKTSVMMSYFFLICSYERPTLQK